ncbi:VOC family protein [Lentzea sp. NPDC058450]|uniref:VOC family protein n=1 Tax=Lentzea sp. NPDC058450 TaxID=3346505 RepID=UPI0036512266
MSTVSYFADDVNEARDWYASFLGVDAYFSRNAPDGVLGYVEFRLGDFQAELGIVQRRFQVTPTDGPSGQILYWAVDDLDATLARLLDLGAEVHDEPRERGDGFVTASVVDPFGNILGVMTNVHYLSVVEGLRS